jgi:hypothetical protein
MKVVVIIPSRYQSSRFMGKPLADVLGKPMIQHVYEQVLKSKTATFAAVATDDKRIFEAVEKFGGRVILTSADHPSGTDRIAEAAEKLGLADRDIPVFLRTAYRVHRNQEGFGCPKHVVEHLDARPFKEAVTGFRVTTGSCRNRSSERGRA